MQKGLTWLIHSVIELHAGTNDHDVHIRYGSNQKHSRLRCLLRIKGLVILFLFGLVWQYSSVQTKYNKGRFIVMATYLQQ